MFKEGNCLYICKNDIDKNYSFLMNHGFSGFNKRYLKNEFDEYIYWYGSDKIRLTGSNSDLKRQRHTQFISLYSFHNFVIKGFDK